MRTRTFLRRGVLPLSCLALLMVWTQTGQPQPVPAQPPQQAGLQTPPLVPPATPVPVAIPQTVPADTAIPPLPTQPIPVLAPPATPPTATVEDLIRQLEQLRKQKADLEQREKAVAAKLQERLKEQSDRLTKLGILPSQPVLEAEAKEAEGIAPLLKRSR